MARHVADFWKKKYKNEYLSLPDSDWHQTVARRIPNKSTAQFHAKPYNTVALLGIRICLERGSMPAEKVVSIKDGRRHKIVAWQLLDTR